MRFTLPLFSRRRSAPVLFVGAGPGDPGLLTLSALRALKSAQVVIHDRLVGDGVLALIPRRARRIAMGKAGFGPSTAQSEICARLVAEAQGGQRVVRLKGGDPMIFGRLDEEIDALDAAGLAWDIVPGITAAAAAGAALGQSLTKRGRNASLRILTGHDMAGFADHDWRALARPGQVAAIYMGKKAARFVQGRLLMHGADPATPVCVVENASRPDQRILASSLGLFPEALAGANLGGPAIVMLGLTARSAAAEITDIMQQKVS
ncbi:uroporphyrinogen-III C-methyltransferase [Thalassococcus sp. CAU 1522]|uniref:uroporphyrinogen-III C-methyltransferase n=1 Tax=Thalassococcus arenae TaxID=2851652 RepID=A0ABS6NA37_9RHOB|nr:uroporphyrinogen-III C-methyltransferase [Thalassococcus arenae]MBV2360658.1 uroporphyrinogen-III C-methyltransferase [Thalassococcus arenae]